MLEGRLSPFLLLLCFVSLSADASSASDNEATLDRNLTQLEVSKARQQAGTTAVPLQSDEFSAALNASRDYDISYHYLLATEEFTDENLPLNISQIQLLMNSLYEKFFDTEAYHQKLNLLRYSITSLGKSDFSEDLWLNFAELEVKLSRFIFARRYIDRTVYILIFVVGMIGNITLIIIFIRHEEIRTVPNMIILSIAISDSLSLIGILPIYYLTISIGAESFMELSSCYYYAFYRVTLMSVTELSVATLSIQRLLATKVLQKENSIFLLMTTSYKIVGWAIFAIWITSMLVTAPVFFVFEFVDGTCFPYIIQTTIHKTCLVFYIVFFITFPFPIVYLSGLTAWRLSKISRVPARTALVITILAIFYLLVYIPRAAWYGYASWVHTNRHDSTFLYIDMVLSYLHFMDSCLNPVALFIASRSFRKLFIHYLCSCSCRRKTHQLQINTSSGTCNTSQM